MKAAIGAAIVAAHALGFVALAHHSAGTPLTVELAGPLSFEGTTLAAATVTTDAGPGLRHRRWTTQYRGEFTREVGASQLVGPFQDHQACSGRVVIGQRLLDDGQASAGTIAGAMAREIDAELRGEEIFPIGAYERIEHLSLRWATLAAHPADRELVGAAPHGYVRAAATLVFQRVEVPIVVALVPERTGDAIHFRTAAHAELGFGNPAIQWLSDELDVDKLASRFARKQLDEALVTTLAPPPPFALPGGQTLAFTYCDGPIEIADGTYGALPFAVAFGRAGHLAPPHVTTAHAPPTASSLAIDLDPDALDAMLFELWRTGWLDRQLATAELDRTFNTDPTVVEYLSLRISPLRLALPPVIEPGPAGTLRLAADARVAIADGGTITTGRLYGALDFRFARSLAPVAPVAVDLGALELSCERTPTSLVPCYGDLVAALRDRGADFHGALTDAFAKLLAEIFVDRHVGAPGLPAELVIHGSVPSLAAGSVHLELDASLM